MGPLCGIKWPGILLFASTLSVMVFHWTIAGNRERQKTNKLCKAWSTQVLAGKSNWLESSCWLLFEPAPVSWPPSSAVLWPAQSKLSIQNMGSYLKKFKSIFLTKCVKCALFWFRLGFFEMSWGCHNVDLKLEYDQFHYQKYEYDHSSDHDTDHDLPFDRLYSLTSLLATISKGTVCTKLTVAVHTINFTL